MNPQNLVLGILLIAGSLATIVGIAVHPPGEGESNAETMQLIVDEEGVWRLSHWLLGFGLAVIAAAGVGLVLTNTGLGKDNLAKIGWGMAAVFSPLALLAILSEATILSDIALAGNQEFFDYWYDGVTIGLFEAVGWFIFIGWALVAYAQIRATDRVMPVWSSWVAFVASVLSLGAPLGLALENPAITMMFLAIIVAQLWFLWYGIKLVIARAEAAPARSRAKAAA